MGEAIWKPMAGAPTDRTMFIGFDTKHGKVMVRRWYEGPTLHIETWPIDPCGIIDPPDPHVWMTIEEYEA